MRIAQEEGWLLGSRSDYPTYGLPMTLIDIDYKGKTDFEKHIAVVAKTRPKYACAEDLSDKVFDLTDIERAILQVKRLANYCEYPIIIPKLEEQINYIDEKITIGYSIPTSNGGAKYAPEMLSGRKVHLLGGSPQQQIQIYQQIIKKVNVGSVDCNMHQRMANEQCKYWQVITRRSRFRRLQTTGDWFLFPGNKKDENRQLNCFRLSCCNIYQAWQEPSVLSGKTFAIQLELMA